MTLARLLLLVSTASILRFFIRLGIFGLLLMSALDSSFLVLPFGTAFGAYALWVLLRDDGRRLFEPAR